MKQIIKYKQTNVMEICTIDGSKTFKLMPGANTIDSELWAEMKKHPSVKNLMDEDIIDDSVKYPFEKMQEKEQLRLVNETVVTEMLEDWLTKAKSLKVQNAIKAQISKIELTEEEKVQKQKTQLVGDQATA